MIGRRHFQPRFCLWVRWNRVLPRSQFEGDSAWETQVENERQAFSNERMRRASYPSPNSSVASPRSMQRPFAMTCGQYYRTWRNTNSFGLIRTCGATGWTDSLVIDTGGPDPPARFLRLGAPYHRDGVPDTYFAVGVVGCALCSGAVCLRLVEDGR
jgi:hypothetical protein